MALSPLKFSLVVSLLVHGLAIGSAVWLGAFHRSAVVEVGDVTTLELIAAPTAAPAALVEPASTTAMTPPPPSTPPPPPEEMVQPSIPELPVAGEVLVPPAPPLQPVAEPTATATITPPPTAPPPAATATISGDNSAPLPGTDFSTVAGNPTAKAKPDYLKNPKPKYPPVAERRNQQGTVVLNVTVSASGRAIKIAIKKSSGFELLDQAAITAVREWEFTPARIGTQAVESEIEVPWRFTLSN